MYLSKYSVALVKQQLVKGGYKYSMIDVGIKELDMGELEVCLRNSKLIFEALSLEMDRRNAVERETEVCKE